MIKKIIFIVLSVLLGLVFILSGLSKLFPIELFELTFIDLGFAGWQTAPFISRLFIAAEFFLGIMLILNIRMRKFTLKATIVMLLIFTVYLIIILIAEGNKGNCKCFGDILVMTPLESIIKNIIMIVVALVLYIFHPNFKYRFQTLLIILGVLSSVSLPYIINPPDFIVSYQQSPESTGYKINLDTLYSSNDIVKPEVDLRKGKHIISFMSLRCRHCKIAAYKMHIMHKQNPAIPFYLILNGKTNDLQTFFDETKTTDIPHMILLGERFRKLAGYSLPSILYINNTFVEKKVNYISMDYKEIIEWLK